MNVKLVSAAIVAGFITFSAMADDDWSREQKSLASLIGPEPQADSLSKSIGVIDRWLQEGTTGYRFERYGVSVGEYQGQKAWVVDYYFASRNAYGDLTDCHVKVYFRNGEPIGATEPHSLADDESAEREAQAEARQKIAKELADEESAQREEQQKIEEEKKADELKRIRNRLLLSGGDFGREGDFVYAYAKVTNNSGASVQFIEVHVVGYNSANEIVSYQDTYAVGSEYLRPGETAKFKAMLDDDHREISSVGWKIAPINEGQVLTRSSAQ